MRSNGAANMFGGQAADDRHGIVSSLAMLRSQS
jgi:hypothetical protein